MRGILGEEVVKKVGPIWGHDEEGEIRGCWRKSGQEVMGAYLLAL
jgi:putative flavoprotein involved in K+ transport